MSMVLLCESCWFERENVEEQVNTSQVKLVQYLDLESVAGNAPLPAPKVIGTS
jgi:hypothetical protein